MMLLEDQFSQRRALVVQNVSLLRGVGGQSDAAIGQILRDAVCKNIFPVVRMGTFVLF